MEVAESSLKELTTSLMCFNYSQFLVIFFDYVFFLSFFQLYSYNNEQSNGVQGIILNIPLKKSSGGFIYRLLLPFSALLSVCAEESSCDVKPKKKRKRTKFFVKNLRMKRVRRIKSIFSKIKRDGGR